MAALQPRHPECGKGGGALVNARGALIGINTAIATLGGGEQQAGGSIGLGFAIPIDQAIRVANDTIYGLGAGVWARSGTTAYKAGRAIQAGRVWVNQYHTYPAHAAFGGYKQSGIGRENHLKMLDHYQQTKNLLVSYAEGAMGFF